MADKIRSLQESWDEVGHEYMALHKRDEAEAGEAHLNDWVADNSLEIRLQIYKQGFLFALAEVEAALVEAGGNIEEATEALYEIAREEGHDDPRSETLTAAERNPGMAGRYHG